MPVRTDTPLRPALRALLAAAAGLSVALLFAPPARAGDAPQWMRSLLNSPLPQHDEKTPAVMLYSEVNVTVQDNDRIKTVSRWAYKILRPSGRDFADFGAIFDSQTRIRGIRGWCIPPQGKAYEVGDKDSIEASIPNIPGSELISDIRFKILHVPAADPGAIVGFELEQDDRPYILQDVWMFQKSVPVGQERYSLELPNGWEYKTVFLNAPEIVPTHDSGNSWTWSVSNVTPLKSEADMPPRRGIAGQMIVNFLPPSGTNGGANTGNWDAIGNWYNLLLRDRLDAPLELQQKVAQLTSGQSTLLGKMQAIAHYLQNDVRYVAIELGIGGWQPHAAADVFKNRYGDCKDKVTLMRVMLQQIGVTSYHLAINTERGSVTPAMPGHIEAFDHVILAILVPQGLDTSSLDSHLDVPGVGFLLLFDPTDDLTPFGKLNGALQGSYALLMAPQGGKLIETPQLPAFLNGVGRKGIFTLDASGTLSGQVTEIRRGDRAASFRASLRSVGQSSDRIRPFETLLSRSLSTFRLSNATVSNVDHIDLPLESQYSFTAESYAKRAGQLLILRPRVFGSYGSGLLETKEPRQEPVVFDGPERDSETFEITLPAGYVVDDLPPPIDLDYGFASYHSKSEVKGNVLVYTRTMEIKELIVPLNKVDQLRKFYRVIASDERNDAVLKPGS